MYQPGPGLAAVEDGLARPPFRVSRALADRWPRLPTELPTPGPRT